MENFVVYMYNIPKVSEDGKVIDIPPDQKQEFQSEEEAKKSAADHKDKFDRVVVIKETEAEKEEGKEGEEGNKEEEPKKEQKMVERYIEGKKE